MTTAGHAVVLGPAPGVVWALDDESVTIVPAHGPTHVLRGLDATIWGWMDAGANEQLVEFVAKMTDSAPEDAANAVATRLTRWIELGILVPAPERRAHHG